MSSKNRFRPAPGKPQNPLLGQSQGGYSQAPDCFCVSFKHFDRGTQGQTFEKWEENGLLALMLNRFHAHCALPLQQCLGDKFHRYGTFPPKTKFSHPKHVPPDADWASCTSKEKNALEGILLEMCFTSFFSTQNITSGSPRKRALEGLCPASMSAKRDASSALKVLPAPAAARHNF
jgi:hypothetical protein